MKVVKTIKNKSNNLLIDWVIRIGCTLLLVFFLWRLNFDLVLIFSNVLRASFVFTMFSAALIVPILVLKTWRWQLILKHFELRTKFEKAFRLYALGLSVGSFTPGQAGDFVKVWHLGLKGKLLNLALITVILDRVFDLLVLFLIASASLIILGSEFTKDLPLLLVLAALSLLMLIFLALPVLRDWSLNFIKRWVVGKNFNDTQVVLSNFVETKPNKIAILKKTGLALFLTLLTTTFAIVRLWLMANAIGLPLTLTQSVIASSLSTVASLLPISIGGIGVRDLTLVALLGKMGYTPESAIALSSLLLLLNLVNLVFGYLVWITPVWVKRLLALKGKNSNSPCEN